MLLKLYKNIDSIIQHYRIPTSMPLRTHFATVGTKTVGGFPIHVRFDEYTKEFEYAEGLVSVAERTQELLSGMQIKLGGTAAEGAYTAHYIASNEDVIIDFDQAHVTLLYTRKYRLQDEDTSNPHTKTLFTANRS